MRWYRRAKGAAFLGGIALPLAVTHTAYADPTARAGGDSASGVIPEIVVTATKQESLLSDTPMSISVLGGVKSKDEASAISTILRRPYLEFHCKHSVRAPFR